MQAQASPLVLPRDSPIVRLVIHNTGVILKKRRPSQSEGLPMKDLCIHPHRGEHSMRLETGSRRA